MNGSMVRRSWAVKGVDRCWTRSDQGWVRHAASPFQRIPEVGYAYPSIELSETLEGEVVDIHQSRGNSEQRVIFESVWASLDFQSFLKRPLVLGGATQYWRVLQSLRADSAVHFLDNLAWRAEGSNPVTSWTFDETTSTANHPAELTPLQGTHSTPSSNSCAVCGGSKTPGIGADRVNSLDGEGKSAKA